MVYSIDTLCWEFKIYYYTALSTTFWSVDAYARFHLNLFISGSCVASG